MGPTQEWRVRAVSCSITRLASVRPARLPQLDGIRFSHQWGGTIDTCSRFFSFLDTAHGGLTVRAAGFTGLGAGASRFAAQVLLDLASAEDVAETVAAALRASSPGHAPRRWNARS